MMMIIIIIIIIQFFIYLRAELNRQWPITGQHEYKQQQQEDNTGQNKQK
jgi:hypothetical protein